MTNPAEPAKNNRARILRVINHAQQPEDGKIPAWQDRVYVKSSPIDRLGVFARRNFATGELIVVRQERPVTPGRPLRPELGEYEHHCDWLADGRQVYLGFPERHINHSCDANAFVRFEEGAGRVIALRPIRVNEEITNNYSINMWGGREWRCTCGSPRCLSVIPGSFFALPIDRQIELSPFLAPWFVQAHKAEWDAFLEVTGLEDPVIHS